uniref:CD37 molecule n=1 Tax=Buteo japonicus TaxID=224669 RepID=A0A8C0B2H3_9AVES
SFAAVLGSPLYSLRVWSYVFSGVGIVTMLLGFLGCLGALKEIKAMLLLYFGILLLLFAAQITVALGCRPAAGETSQGPGGPLSLTAAPLTTCPQLACCGWNGPQDWDRRDGLRGVLELWGSAEQQGGLWPGGSKQRPRLSPRSRQGCAEGVKGWLAENLVTVVGICLGIGLLEVGGLPPGWGSHPGCCSRGVHMELVTSHG